MNLFKKKTDKEEEPVTEAPTTEALDTVPPKTVERENSPVTAKTPELSNEEEAQELTEDNLNELDEASKGDLEPAGDIDEGATLDELKATNKELQQRLQDTLVIADGRLADPKDLPFNPEFLEDPGALDAAIADLIKSKPGLKAKQFTGNIGAGKQGATKSPKPDLITAIRGY